ncbi:LacI family DNA-binding transcriptional regulator [Nonomuraea jabiensis]|uniref:DNA-binding LacI/PurR family transcriptional regulator n=1 Tax=Nonomuraea jabiensis TaxID=882448 RepID=A0A7W9GIG2_9ACTN|nr:LacI family DNA-binding transcriptional regulator [Nonomuraea jabiensis]MBB5784298.1 DNA-binding LacI/PurR family transcriptional regulator [Nonomuraea jabiensis]
MDVTIYEVAQRAGVSIATVSRALRGTGPVAARTREKVLKAVEELNFTPSHLGVSLAEGRHAANGIVFPDLAGPYYTEVLLGYEEVASELGRSVVILSTKGRSRVNDLVKDLAGRVDGMLIFGHTVPEPLVAELVLLRMRLVFISRDPLTGADTLRSENRASAGALAEHLAGHGYERFAFLGAPMASQDDVDERWQGVRAVLGGAIEAVDTRHYTVECGFEAARGLLKGRRRPEAIICSDDEVALGALLAAEELGLSVPGDLAVTGWDDIMAARHARPALTTVRQPMRELGARAARALDELITGARHLPRHQSLPTELVIRSSCGHHPETSPNPDRRAGDPFRPR